MITALTFLLWLVVVFAAVSLLAFLVFVAAFAYEAVRS